MMRREALPPDDGGGGGEPDPGSGGGSPLRKGVAFAVGYRKNSGDMMVYGGGAVTLIGVVATVVNAQPAFMIASLAGTISAFYFWPTMAFDRPQLGADARGIYVAHVGLIRWSAVADWWVERRALRTMHLATLEIRLAVPLEEALEEAESVPGAERFMSRNEGSLARIDPRDTSYAGDGRSRDRGAVAHARRGGLRDDQPRTGGGPARPCRDPGRQMDCQPRSSDRPSRWTPRCTRFFEEMRRELTPAQPISPERRPYSIFGQRSWMTVTPASARARTAGRIVAHAELEPDHTRERVEGECLVHNAWHRVGRAENIDHVNRTVGTSASEA